MLAFAGLAVLEGFVSHCEPFEADDADEFIAVFPDLALSKFERHAIVFGRGGIRLSGH
jgi:hypothetical protein